MAPAAAKSVAAASQPRAPTAMRADVSGSLLLGLRPDAGADDIEYVLGDVQRTLSRLASKRETLQDQIAAACRGKRRAPRTRRAPPPRAAAPAAVVVGAPVVPAAGNDDDPGARYAYTREGAGAVRRRLRAAAGDVKKERKRLEAAWGDLEEALVDARERLALQEGTA